MSMQIDAQEIILIVAQHVDIPVGLLISAHRRADVVQARHIAYWLVKKHGPHMSASQIGAVFGGRDHTTVLHGISAVSDRIDRYPTFRASVDEIDDLIARRKLRFIRHGAVTAVDGVFATHRTAPSPTSGDRP